MAVAKTTIQKQLDAAEERVKKLKAKLAEQVIEKSSPGMEQLLAALDVVTKENGCSVFDVLKSVSRIRRTGAKIAPPIKKKREAKLVEGEAKLAKAARVGQNKKGL